MIKPKREDALLKEINLRGSVSTADFSERLGVSAVTLRRDLASLEARGLVRRVHGGATAAKRDDPASRRRSTPGTIPTIGMIAPTTGNYYADIIRSAKQTAHQHGVRLVLGISNYVESEERVLVEGMIAAGADGLLVTPSRVDFSGPTLELLSSAPVPVVLIERSVDQFTGSGRLESVRSDHEFGAELCVHHLFDQGHRRIALLTAGNPTSPRLLAGYGTATAELGLDSIHPGGDVWTAAWDTEEQRAEIARLIAGLLAEGVTALVVQPDWRAMVIVQEALKAGIAVPRDLAVVAYDDQFSELAEVPLTAVSPPSEELGRTAIERCLHRMRQSVGDRGRSPQQVRIVPTLNIRSSSVTQ